MKYKIGFFTAVVLLIASLAVNIAGLAKTQANKPDETSGVSRPNEEYVYVAVFKNDPMIITQDEVGLKAFADEYNVKATLTAPEKYDAPAVAKILDEVIAGKPAGIMVCGSDKIYIPYIDKAIDMGIPVITVDADVPESKRLAFVGSDWYKIGSKQAEAMVKLIGGKGIVAMLGMVGSDNMQRGFEGFRNVMKNYSDVVVLNEFDDMTNPKEAARITENLLNQYPDIAGIAAFDSNSAPGIVETLKTKGLIGKVKVTSVDIAPIHLQLLKDGSVQKLVGQKRELFTYYGGKILYDLNHSALKLAKQDREQGITNIPASVDTGLVELDAGNVDAFSR